MITGGPGLIDGRSLWLAGSKLVRMDIPWPRKSAASGCPGTRRKDGLAGLARGDGSFWVARPEAGELLRVGPASGRVEHRFRGLPDAGEVVFGDGAILVASGARRRSDRSAADRITASAAVPEPGLANLALGGGSSGPPTRRKGTMYKARRRSGETVATYETGDGARQESYADGSVWVVNLDAAP